MASKFGSGSQTLKEASKGAAFSRTHYFGIEDGKHEYVRFLTDFEEQPGADHVGAWITVDQHGHVPTRPKPDWVKKEARWPDHFGVVCRNTKCRGLPGDPPLYTVMDDASEKEGCFVCEMRSKDGKPYRASSRGWALGCLREPVYGDGSEEQGGPSRKGKLIGLVDKVREVEKEDGSVVKEKAVVVFNMGWKNFFSTLEGFGSHYGTVLDRDYKITRQGEGTATDYQIVPMDPVPGPNGDTFDLRIQEYMDRYDIGLDLDTVVEDQAKAAFHRRWFDPSYTPPKRGDSDSKSEAKSEESAPATPDNSESDMQAMANRVMAYGQAKGEGEGKGDASDSDGEPKKDQSPSGFQFIES